MIDPRTTNLIGQHILIVRRGVISTAPQVLGRGIVRVVDYQGSSFALLIEAVGAISDWYIVGDGGLFEVSAADETVEVIMDHEKQRDCEKQRPPVGWRSVDWRVDRNVDVPIAELQDRFIELGNERDCLAAECAVQAAELAKLKPETGMSLNLNPAQGAKDFNPKQWAEDYAREKLNRNATRVAHDIVRDAFLAGYFVAVLKSSGELSTNESEGSSDICLELPAAAGTSRDPQRACISCKGKRFQIKSDGPHQAWLKCLECGADQ